MKKILALVCIFSMITSLTACSHSDETAEENVPETEIEVKEVSVTESETSEKETNQHDVSGETISAEERTMSTEREAVDYGELFSEIDSEFVQEEADTAKKIALICLESMQSDDVQKVAETFAEYADVNMAYYGAFGENPDTESLAQALAEEVTEIPVFPQTFVFTPDDVQVAGEDDVFWEVLKSDSELMQDIYWGYDYDISDCYQMDKAYKVNFTITDESNSAYHDTGTLYIARVNSEWKYESIFNTMYDAYYNNEENPLENISENEKLNEPLY